MITGNTLITAASSAEAHRVKTKLESENILLGDHLALPAFMLSSGKMIKLPNPDAATYPHEMLTLCLDNDISKVYLFREKEIAMLTESALLFNEYGIEIIIERDEV